MAMARTYSVVSALFSVSVLGACASPSPHEGTGSAHQAASTHHDPSDGKPVVLEDTDCYSPTMDRHVSDGDCVQSAATHTYYMCSRGEWEDANYALDEACYWIYIECESATLGANVRPAACVQQSGGAWYQCTTDGEWKPGGGDGSGPIGECSVSYAYAP